MQRVHALELNHMVTPCLFRGMYPFSVTLPLFTKKSSQVFIKRDDTLGEGRAGTKYRKYSSLFKAAVQKGYSQLAAFGSSESNLLPTMGSLAIRNGFDFHAWYPRFKTRDDHYEDSEKTIPAPPEKKILNIILHEANLHPMQFETRVPWYQVEKEFLEQVKVEQPMAMAIPEGAAFEHSIPGLMTLALEIYEYNESKTSFDHIFLDAGTGIAAWVTLITLKALKISAQIHIVSMAEKSAEKLEQRFALYENMFKNAMEYRLLYDTVFSDNQNHKDIYSYTFHRPEICPGFGSTNKKLLQYRTDFAHKYGILGDTVYSTKMFYTIDSMIDKEMIKGNVLAVHSGALLA